MHEFPYTTVPGRLKPLLETIRRVSLPEKVTAEWLISVGFASTNDASLLGVLRFLGFVDVSRVPTARWTTYRGDDPRKVLGEAIRQSYGELFAAFPDAHLREHPDLEKVFSNGSRGRQVVSKMISTFRTLCENGDIPKQLTPPALFIARPNANGAASPTIQIGLQVNISPEAPPEQIDQIFASMARYLVRRIEGAA